MSYRMKIHIARLCGVLLCCLWNLNQAADDGFAKLRREMVAEIEQDARETASYIDKQALDPRVMQVIGRVPREEFVPDYQKPHAYENRPLAIGHGQTISQPYIVALMAEALKLDRDSVVLEIGAGCGYAAAVTRMPSKGASLAQP